MGEQYEFVKAVYISDALDEFVVKLRLEQAVVGGFSIVDPTLNVTLPRNMKMRYVIGYDSYYNATHKQFVANPGDPFFAAGQSFYYLAGVFFIGAQVGEKYPNK